MDMFNMKPGTVVPMDSMARLDAMQAILTPSLTHEQILCELNANLELLYIKAKNFHWNVTGVGFQGVHELFDRIHEYAEEQADRVAERMRSYRWPVCGTASSFLKCAWFPEGDCTLNQAGMLCDMAKTLDCFHAHIIDTLPSVPCPVSQNMMQDICEGLDRYNFMVKSNCPEIAGTMSSGK